MILKVVPKVRAVNTWFGRAETRYIGLLFNLVMLDGVGGLVLGWLLRGVLLRWGGFLLTKGLWAT